MRTHRFAPYAARVGGLLAGLAFVAAAVALWRVPGGTRTVGADVRLLARPTGEFAVAPTGAFLVESGLHPSAGPRERHPLTVRNQTGTGLSLRLRSATATDLDDVLWIELAADGERLYRGSLAGLRRGSRALPVAAGTSAVVDVSAWVPSDVTAGYQARSETVELELRAGTGGTR